MKNDPQVCREVTRVVDGLWRAYAAKDLNGVLALFAPDADLVAIGTGADEVVVGWDNLAAAFKRDFAQAGDIAPMETSNLAVQHNGDVAWLAAETRISLKVDGKDLNLNGRLTFVLEKRGENWLIVQEHLSLPAVEQEEGRSFAKP